MHLRFKSLLVILILSIGISQESSAEEITAETLKDFWKRADEASSKAVVVYPRPYTWIELKRESAEFATSTVPAGLVLSLNAGIIWAARNGLIQYWDPRLPAVLNAVGLIIVPLGLVAVTGLALALPVMVAKSAMDINPRLLNSKDLESWLTDYTSELPGEKVKIANRIIEDAITKWNEEAMKLEADLSKWRIGFPDDDIKRRIEKMARIRAISFWIAGTFLDNEWKNHERRINRIQSRADVQLRFPSTKEFREISLHLGREQRRAGISCESFIKDFRRP